MRSVRKYLKISLDSIDVRSLFWELYAYVELELHKILRKYSLDDSFISIIGLVNSRYCGISRLMRGYDHVINCILKDRLRPCSKSNLIKIIENVRSRISEHELIDLRNRIMLDLRMSVPYMIVSYPVKNQSFWQQLGLMLADGSDGAQFCASNEYQFETLLKTFGEVLVKLKTFYIEASTNTIAIEFLIYPRDRTIRRLLSKYRQYIIKNPQYLNQLKFRDWVRFFAGMFDGDGFIKVKHRYAIDVGISCGRNLKGDAVKKILSIGEQKGYYDLGRYDSRSCKVYLRLSGRSLRFLRRVVGFLFHVDRRFKLERFLFARGLVVPG